MEGAPRVAHVVRDPEQVALARRLEERRTARRELARTTRVRGQCVTYGALALGGLGLASFFVSLPHEITGTLSMFFAWGGTIFGGIWLLMVGRRTVRKSRELEREVDQEPDAARRRIDA